MKSIIRIFFLAAFLMLMPETSQAQTRGKGFDYKAHKSQNAKAQKWAKRRVKASKGDQTNVQCSPRTTRRHARRAKG